MITCDFLKNIVGSLKDDVSHEEILDWLKHLNCSISTEPEKTHAVIDDFMFRYCEQYHYCPNCLVKMRLRKYKENRPYGEGFVQEDMNEYYCPCCGKPSDFLF